MLAVFVMLLVADTVLVSDAEILELELHELDAETDVVGESVEVTLTVGDMLEDMLTLQVAL